MAIVLYNPTNEDMQTQYVGEDVIIEGESAAHLDAEGNPRPARCKIRVDDQRGKQVLNVLGPRGLVTLEYGDEGGGEEKKAEAGRKRNQDFKYEQVIKFNTLNEQRYQSRHPYIKPKEHIKRYADELGIQLRQPYAVEDEAKKDMADAMQRNQQLEREVKKKDSELSELRDQVAELTSQFRMFLQRAAGESDTRVTVEALVGKWKTMGAPTLAPWIDKNWEHLMLLPDDAAKDLAERFERVYSKKMPKEREKLAPFVSDKAA